MITDEIKDLLENRNGTMTFTLELGKGETYANRRPTLYAHDSYPKSSVLRGQSRRRWVGDWETREEALAALDAIKLRGFKWRDLSGTTHVPVAVMTAHLPDGEDA